MEAAEQEAGKWHNVLKSKMADAVGGAETSEMVSAGLKSLSRGFGGLRKGKGRKPATAMMTEPEPESEVAVDAQAADAVSNAAAARHGRLHRMDGPAPGPE
eukprot:COSAG01_NODE_300_length_19226_cov_41.536519_20_plen_101_part_00